MIERIGLANFVEGLGLEVDPNMVVHPRCNPYVRMDDWEEQAAKWNDKKGAASAEKDAAAEPAAAAE